MKRPILTLLAIMLSIASISSTPASANPPRFVLAPNTIDGVSVPQEILMDVQMEHQGYAVSAAKKIQRGGQWFYQLRVDQDNIPNDFDSFYLLYDLEWNPVAREDIHAPPPPEAPPPAAPPAEENPTESSPEHNSDNSGQGGEGGNTNEEQPPPDTGGEGNEEVPPPEENPTP